MPAWQQRRMYFGLAGVVMALGLASRRYSSSLPQFIATYAGDTLWALLVFLLISSVAPRTSLFRRGMTAALFAFAIEFSQLYHADWIDRIRDTTLGGLVLGFGFLWSDLACYLAGIGVGVACERGFAAAIRATMDRKNNRKRGKLGKPDN